MHNRGMNYEAVDGSGGRREQEVFEKFFGCRRSGREKFWMVLIGGRGASTCRHYTLQAARSEAERLLNLPDNQGRNVYILAAMSVGYHAPMPIVWERLWW